MGWHLWVYKYGGTPPRIDDYEWLDDQRQPWELLSLNMGTPAEIRAKIEAIVGSVKWESEVSGWFERDGSAMEIYFEGLEHDPTPISDTATVEEIVEQSLIELRHIPEQVRRIDTVIRWKTHVFSLLAQLATTNGWSIYDTTSGGWIVLEIEQASQSSDW